MLTSEIIYMIISSSSTLMIDSYSYSRTSTYDAFLHGFFEHLAFHFKASIYLLSEFLPLSLHSRSEISHIAGGRLSYELALSEKSFCRYAREFLMSMHEENMRCNFRAELVNRF